MSKENFGNQELLTIRGLSISFQQYEKGTRQNLLPVIRDLQATVREKEIVAILTPRPQKQEIMRAINKAAGLTTESAGILFSLPVDDMIGLQAPITPPEE